MLLVSGRLFVSKTMIPEAVSTFSLPQHAATAILSVDWGFGLLSGRGGSDILGFRTLEGSHSGLVRAPAKRLSWETGIVGSNPTPSAAHLFPRPGNKASLACSDSPKVPSVSSRNVPQIPHIRRQMVSDKQGVTWLDSLSPRLRLSPDRLTVHGQFDQNGTHAIALVS